MYSDSVLLNSVDLVVEQILDMAGIENPPVDALELSKYLGISVLLDSSQSNRGRQKEISGHPVILIRPEDRPERIQWTVAHEIGEIIAHRIYENDPDLFDDSLHRMRENISNLVACRLLVPEKWFRNDCSSVQFDLFELKKQYQTASHEIIANRFYEMDHQLIVSIYDQGNLTRRNWYHSGLPPAPGLFENRVREECHQKSLPIHREKSGFEITCWPVHEGEWKREILCTRFPDESYEMELSELFQDENVQIPI